MNNELYGLILAGGSGSRLWPMSRELYPKQLLKIVDKTTFFQATFNRLTNNINYKNIYIITNIKHSSSIKMQLNECYSKYKSNQNDKVITEPIGRNTAPAIALATKYIKEKAVKVKDPIILVIPSDQTIGDEIEFSKSIKNGIKLAKEGYIVTFGIVPQRIDTGFGYIKTCENKKIQGLVESALKVSEFKEKPDYKTAEEYVKSGKYFWNSGIFMFKVSTFMNELEKYSPKIFSILETAKINEKEPSIDYDIFSKMPNISIDYEIMEKSDKITLLPMDCKWNDLGSWQAIYDVSKKDKKGNFIAGNVIDINSKNSMIYSTSKLVTTIGLEDTAVIETEDAILVCNKKQTQDVKKIYNKLKEMNNPTYKIHRTVYKPWGFYTLMQKEDSFLIKIISVNPKAKISLQKHFCRSKYWVVLEGNALVIKEKEKYKLKTGESINIEIEKNYSLQNPYENTLKLLEVQIGDKLEEEDIVRFEDI